MTDPRRDAHRAIEAVARHSYGRLVAYLASRTHDVAGAEDALGDALVAALTKWPSDGVPNSPEAWLLTSARNRLIDRNRHHRVRERVRERVHNEDALELLSHGVEEPMQADPFPDDRLKLLFVCAHPAIDPAMHTPLMLQAVLGLDAAAIARAFVVAPTTMSQRLVRAKAKIRETGIAFEVPEADQLGERLEAVLNAVYAAFGSGWDAIPGIDSASVGLTDEAIWLARVLSERLPDEPEVRGLLALMLYCDARRAARRGSDGRFIPLSEQDPARWDSASIAGAERELVLAGRSVSPRPFSARSRHPVRACGARADGRDRLERHRHALRRTGAARTNARRASGPRRGGCGSARRGDGAGIARRHRRSSRELSTVLGGSRASDAEACANRRGRSSVRSRGGSGDRPRGAQLPATQSQRAPSSRVRTPVGEAKSRRPTANERVVAQPLRATSRRRRASP
jgi:RNA polymerase sigma-70 factor (ECF subfamily)